MNITKLTRRNFLKLTGVTASSAFIFGIDLSAQEKSKGSFSPDVFVEITPQNIVKIIAHRSEMGTGIRTSLPAVVADELEADWKKVEIIQGLGDKKFGSQNTDGSRSIRRFFDRMREAGALTGLMLEMAAAKKWGVPLAECHREKHKVYHKKSGRSIDYGDLVKEASKLPVPSKGKLKFKDASKRIYIGKEFKNFDQEKIVMGEAVYGHDIKLEGMLYAAIARPPAVGGEAISYNQKQVEALAGVSKSLTIPKFTGVPHFKALGGVAVLANNTYNALKAKEALKVKWKGGPNATFDSKKYQRYLNTEVQKKGAVKRKRGDYYASKKGAEVAKATYNSPFLVHQQMEPVVATADFKDGMCIIWAPTQNPQAVQQSVAQELKIKPSDVVVHVTLLGGGFGRKSKADYTVEAALLSKAAGKPVQVIWSREDDTKHGYYHAMAAMHLEATFKAGKVIPEGLLMRTVFPPIASLFIPNAKVDLPAILGMGFTDIPYDIKSIQCEVGQAPAHVRIGWMRAVANIQNVFALATFIDELANRAKMDPVKYQNLFIGKTKVHKKNPDSGVNQNYDEPWEKFPMDTGRLKNTLNHLAEKFNWERKLPKGHGKGIAVYRSFLTYIAVAAEVFVDKNGKLKLIRLDIACDCGLVVDPDRVRAQMEGSLVFGATIALMGEISMKNGAIEQSNFHDAPVARMSDVDAEINVHLINSDNPPSGVGEPGVPPVAPAICNAIFDACGKRVRQLPISKTSLKA